MIMPWMSNGNALDYANGLRENKDLGKTLVAMLNRMVSVMGVFPCSLLCVLKLCCPSCIRLPLASSTCIPKG